MILAAALLLSTGLTPHLWHEPGAVETIDFVRPALGRELPMPPFLFLEESLSGTSAKVLVRDSAGVTWQVKGGPEGRAEAFVTRLVAALGYFAETTCFIANGRIEGIQAPLRRASGFIQPDGRFTSATFERRIEGAEYLDVHWSYLDSPFRGTPQMKGLKILVMLVSNWDNKDSRDIRLGSNTGVLKTTMQGEMRAVYFINDWGQSLGGWGSLFGRSHWNCRDFARQTPRFVRGVREGRVLFGYGGQHTKGFRDDITVEDVRWLMQYLGRITDAQLLLGLSASGASQEEQRCFAAELRKRIEQLRRVSGELP